MTLKKFKRGNLRHMEHLEFATTMLLLCKEANVEKLNAVLDPLSKSIAAEDEALNQSKVMFGTEDLVKLDDARDKAYLALRLLVKMHLQSDDEETVRAAKRLAEILSRYPHADVQGYVQETGMIKNLVADAQEPDMNAALAKLGAQAAITRLENANKAFADVYHNRVQVSKASGQFDVRALRGAVDKALDAVLTRITALADLEKNPAIDLLIEQYNFQADNWQAHLAQRRAKNRSAHERTMEKYAALIEPLFGELEKERGLSRGALSFAREFRGSGRKRAYLLNVSGSSQIWVVIDAGKLVVVPEPSAGKSKGSAGHSGSGSDSNGSGSGHSGGGHSGSGTGGSGGGTKKPEREEDPGEDQA